MSPAPSTAPGARFFSVCRTALAVICSDGTIVEVNAAWVAMLGDGARWRGQPLASRVSPADREPLTRALDRLKELPSVEVPLSLSRQDGVWVGALCELTADAEHETIFCVARGRPTVSVPSLETALERVRRSESEFRRLLDHVPDGIVVMHDSQFVYANPAAARILGYDNAQQLVGIHFSAIVRPEELPRSVERVRQMGGKSPPPRHERPMVRRDGSTVYAETLGFATEFDGRPATLVIAHDLTDEKQNQEQVRQADRLASLGLLAAGVGHELNNPLAYVLLNLGQVRKWLAQAIAQGGTAPLPGALQLIEQSLEGAERMRAIVGDLRAFSRVDDRQSTPVDVRAVVEAVLPMAEHRIRPRASLRRDFHPVPLVRANEARLGQVFLNLLVNAGQAIPHGDDGRKHEVTVSIRPEADTGVVIQVRDSGVGMPPEILKRVFEPFFTTKPADEGTGLGLSVCMGIVQALGGSLEAQSQPGVGSTFTVRLPVAAAEAPEAQVEPRSLQRARVLVVDDEPQICRGLAQMLEGHDVVVASGGREAISRLFEERFDAVFCDLMMPEVTGSQVYEQVRARDPALASRFVFMTAGAFTPAARAFLDQVPNPRLDKPFQPSEVQKIAALVIANRLPGAGPR